MNSFLPGWTAILQRISVHPGVGVGADATRPQSFPTTHPHLRVPHLRVPHLRRVCAVFALVFLPVLAGQAQAQDITATVEVVANECGQD